MVKLIHNNCNNQFVFNNRYIDNIIFYNDDGFIAETHQGWFRKGVNNYKEFEVGNIKIRNKTSLNKMDKKENFVIPVKDTFGNLKYDLYLYVDNNNIKIVNSLPEHKTMSDTLIFVYEVLKISIFNEIIEIKIYIKSEKTDFGELVSTKLEELKQLDINIDTYDLSLLLKHYNLIKK